jgi:hypothetical protein
LEEDTVETTIYSITASAPAQRNRCGNERHLTLLRVGAIVVEDRRELCLIRNVSAGGMMIRAYSDITVGTPLTIELKQGDPVSGTVQWIEDGLTGVMFDSPIDVVGLLAPPGDGPRPRLPRIEVECTAWVRQEAQVLRARAVNVAQGGVCVESAAPLTIGGDVVVTLPGLTPTAGVVKWGRDTAYGIGFNRPLVLSDLVQWLQEQQQEQRPKAAV